MLEILRDVSALPLRAGEEVKPTSETNMEQDGLGSMQGNRLFLYILLGQGCLSDLGKIISSLGLSLESLGFGESLTPDGIKPLLQ